MIFTNKLAREIAVAFGTPIFVHLEEMMIKSAQESLVVGALFGLTVRYAVKANPIAGVIKLFDSLGLHFDASSVYEVYRLINAGVAKNKISLTTQQFPENLIGLNNIKINLSSLHQIRRLIALDDGSYQQSGVGLRINPGFGSGHHVKTTVGGPYAGFGIWHEEINQAVELLKKHSYKITRLHIHIGSGADPAMLIKVLRFALLACADLPEVCTVNVGGGFAVNRLNPDYNQYLPDLFKEINDELLQFAQRTGRKISLEIEPGTYLVANSGVLITKVIDIKRIGDKQFVVVDTGMTDIIRPTLYGAIHPIKVISANNQRSNAINNYYVIGHCCESGDMLTVELGNGSQPQAIKLPALQIGDLLLIGGCGAYCDAMNTAGYNSFPRSAVVAVNQFGRVNVWRKRQDWRDLLKNEI